MHVVSDEEADRLGLRAEALDRFSRRYSHNPESRRSMIGGLRRLALTFSDGRYDERSFPWELICDEDLADQVWSAVAERYSRATAIRDASALRVMLECCRRVGLVSYDEARQASSFVANRGQNRDPAGHFLTEEDIGSILRACQTGPGHANTRTRDAALLLALATSGARGEEITGVDMKDLHLDESRIWLTRTKGGSPRNAWLHPTAVHALTAWIKIRGTERGPVFVPLSRTGRPLVDHGRLSTHQARKAITARAAQAGFDGVALHDLRRFLISNLLDHVDVTLVAKVVGHKNPATTAGYDRRPLARQRDAVATLDLPSLHL